MKEKIARENFLSGYNCCQSVVLAFKDELDIDEKTLLKLSSSFGGGVGRLREICGAVSGIAIVLGLKYGYYDTKEFDGKAEHYERIQELALKFKNHFGTYICRELLGLENASTNPVPEKRTAEYYQKRSCDDYVGYAARILEEYINNNN